MGRFHSPANEMLMWSCIVRILPKVQFYFQDTYFSASRLHFIGSWKARNEALLLGMINEGPKPAPPTRGLPRRIVHIDMDCFFASVAGAPCRGKTPSVQHEGCLAGHAMYLKLCCTLKRVWPSCNKTE